MISTPRACCPCNQIETNTDIFPAINPGNPGLDVHLLLGMNPGMPVSTTGLSLTRILIPSLISLMASSGRVEISKFSLMWRALVAVVRGAVMRGFMDALGDARDDRIVE